MNVIRYEVGLFYFCGILLQSWAQWEISQVINHTYSKTSLKTITPNKPDEKIMYLKKKIHKKDFLKGILMDNEVSFPLPSRLCST